MTKGTAVLRQQNEKRILGLLRKEGTTSRLDISRKLNLSKNTVSLIVDKYIKQQIIRETGTHEAPSAGRPKINIEIIPESLKSIGVYLRNQEAYIAVTDYFLTTIDAERLQLDTSDPETCLQKIGSCAADLIRRHPETIGVGVGLPGIVDPERGYVHYSSHMGWEEVDVKAALAPYLSVPLRVMNSVKASALAVVGQLEGEPADSTFYVWIDEGVGGAFLIQDKLHVGGSWTAGEVGHLTVDPDGPNCRCGRKGCLEAFIRSESVGQRLEQLDLEAENVSTAGDAHPGVSPRERLYAEIGRYLSTALAHMIHLCNPKLIVVDSPYSWNAAFREATTEDTLRKTLGFPGDHTEFLFVRNEESPAAGAALAIIQDYEYCG